LTRRLWKKNWEERKGSTVPFHVHAEGGGGEDKVKNAHLGMEGGKNARNIGNSGRK